MYSYQAYCKFWIKRHWQFWDPAELPIGVPSGAIASWDLAEVANGVPSGAIVRWDPAELAIGVPSGAIVS